MLKKIFEKYAEENHAVIREIWPEGEAYPHLGITLTGDHNTWQAFAVPMEENLLLFYVFAAIRIPEEKREKLALVLEKINFELRYAAFYMNPESGEIMVRVSQYIYGSEEEQKFIMARMVQTCGIVMEKYYKQIVDAAFS